MKFYVLIFSLILISFQDGFGCSCDLTPQFDAFKESESVFIGRVSAYDDKGLELRVMKAWKGAKEGKTIKYFVFDLGGCDRDIKWTKDKDYLIYGTKSDFFSDEKKSEPTIFVDCNRSAPLNNNEWNQVWQDPTADIEQMPPILKLIRSKHQLRKSFNILDPRTRIEKYDAISFINLFEAY